MVSGSQRLWTGVSLWLCTGVPLGYLELGLLRVKLTVGVQMMCEDGDLKEMGLPLGPRKKLLSHLHDIKQKQVTLASLSAA